MIGLILGLALVGFLTWLLVTKVPMHPFIKGLIVFVVCACCLIYVLNAFGVGIPYIAVPTIRWKN